MLKVFVLSFTIVALYGSEDNSGFVPNIKNVCAILVLSK